MEVVKSHEEENYVRILTVIIAKSEVHFQSTQLCSLLHKYSWEKHDTGSWLLAYFTFIQGKNNWKYLKPHLGFCYVERRLTFATLNCWTLTLSFTIKGTSAHRKGVAYWVARIAELTTVFAIILLIIMWLNGFFTDLLSLCLPWNIINQRYEVFRAL